MISQRTLCFLHQGGQVLLLHRRQAPNAGMWNGIGGKLEPGEDPFTACIREVKEETGLTISTPRLRGLLVITVKATGDIWIIYVFTAPGSEAPLSASPEGELQWVEITRVIASAAKQSPGEIPALHTPADLPIILPRILKGDGVMVARIDYATDDAVEPLRVEILG